MDIVQDSSLSPGLFGVEGRRCRGERVLFWDEVLEGNGGRGSRRRRIKVAEALWERRVHATTGSGRNCSLVCFCFLG